MPGKSKRAHVVKNGDEWVVKIENQQAPVGAAPTQASAQQLARSIVERATNGGEIIIHRPNGQIRDSDTINRKDPYPPKG